MVHSTVNHSGQTNVPQMERREELFEDQHLPLNLEVYNLLYLRVSCTLYLPRYSAKVKTKIMTTAKVSGL